MRIEQGVFNADGETLAWSRCLSAIEPKARALSLHGAGTGVRQRVYYLAEFMSQLGVETFCFDFSGHGESTGTLAESGLLRRRDQALEAYQHMGGSLPLILMGSSMGGFVATDLLPYVSVDALLLFCPALYAAEALDVRFGDGFSEIIRKENSYEQENVTRNLRDFQGDVAVFIGSEDKVIPSRVIDLYMDACRSARSSQLVRLDGAHHVIHAWAAEKPEHAAKIFEPVKNIIERLSEPL